MSEEMRRRPDQQRASGAPIRRVVGDQQQRNRIQRYLQNFSPWDFVDPSKPWILVPNGSFMGSFNWVPERFRVGPWSPVAVCFYAVLWNLTALTGVSFLFPSFPALETNWSKECFWAAGESAFEQLEYPQAYSSKWWYQVVSFVWMVYMLVMFYKQSTGIQSLFSYTVQSYVLLTVRHALCSLAPFHSRWIWYAELLRFPVACSSTVSFFIWNLILTPYTYFFFMKNEASRRKFLETKASFVMLQIHVFNTVHCVCNVYWANPSRFIDERDLYLAFLSLVLYVVFYLFVLDRLGMHLYPILSPRTGGWLLITWTCTFVSYGLTFLFWRRILKPV